MPQPPTISYECLERLHTWIMAHCPCAMEEEEFISGLKVIIEEELLQALQAERQSILAKISSPSLQ